MSNCMYYNENIVKSNLHFVKLRIAGAACPASLDNWPFMVQTFWAWENHLCATLPLSPAETDQRWPSPPPAFLRLWSSERFACLIYWPPVTWVIASLSSPDCLA